MSFTLLAVFAIPTLSIPLVYLAGKKSPKAAALLVALIAVINIILILTTIPEVLNSPTHRYFESYNWIPMIESSFTLFIDGISASIALITLILIAASSIFSITYMAEKKNLPVYYTLLCILSIGLVGVFLTS